ncbi:baculoviral IAP repeat-containing protein 7-B-like isoform X1 [Dreissena polymorpha]|uniref:baculoviral IAP repeat-containing protein 7-B-like isoform X1 n=1 Tax=Dreissena polymorpha TaxID=45954 RepID=UPI002263D10C|nr:baculoviral IAP repeat-containing protein 7-B-like isoform X1 [Dreissena polymorpha]
MGTFPQNVNVSGLRLANNGFYFTGRDAIVRCFSCHRYHSDWQTDGVLYQVGYWMHEEDCAFMLEMDSSNVPMHRQPGENQHLTNSHLLLGPMAHGLHYMDQGITGEVLPDASGALYYDVTVDLASYRRRHPSDRPSHPLYAIQNLRLISFLNSPSDLQVRGETLTEAGFFYLGYQDRVRCFQCGFEVTVREEDSDQWTAHAQWCPQ